MTAPSTPQGITLMTGNANRDLAAAVAGHLEIELGDMLVGQFADGECKIRGRQNVRGDDLYMLQPTNQPDRNLTELRLMVGATRSSANKITAVIPYWGYARQDRRDQPRVPISVVDMVRTLVHTGIDGVVLLDLHAGQIVGIFEAFNPRLRVDHLYARPVILDWLAEQDLSHATFMAPDIGSAKVVESYWKRGREFAPTIQFGVSHKSGSSDAGVDDIKLLGHFDGQHVYIFDDMVSTAATANIATDAAKSLGASAVTFVANHPVLANHDVARRIAEGSIDHFVTTDTIPIGDEDRTILGPKLTQLSVARLLALAIQQLHEDGSMTALFELEGYRAG